MAVVCRYDIAIVGSVPTSAAAGRYATRQTVRYLLARYGDIFSELYAANGTLIAHRDGCNTGQGDGRASGFRAAREDGQIIWLDQREGACGG